jgi:transposase
MNTTTCESSQNCSKIKELSEENTNLKKEIDNLKRILMRYENPHTPSSRRMYPTRSSDHTKNTKRFPGRPKGHKGTTRPKPTLPHTIKEPEQKHSCDHCGAPLNEPIHVGHHVFEEIANPKPRQVIDYIEFEYKCVMCNLYTQSRHSDCPPDGVFGKNALIQTTLMKFEERLPFKKISQQMKSQFNLPMTPASVLEITRRVSEHLRPEYESILERVRHAKIVNVDETGEKVDGVNHWLWVFTTETDTFFAIRKSRGKKVLDEVLGKDFKGYLGCDGWKSYSNFTGRLQRCWAHLLREAEWLAQHCEEAEPLYLALKRLYADLAACLVGDPPVLVRKKVKARAMGRLRYWIEKDYESKEAKRFIGKVRNGFDYWFTFVLVPGLEGTNNRAERALKEPVVQRKIIGTFRNVKGIRIYETMMSLLATCKQQGLNLYRAMSESLTAAWSKGRS